MGLRADIQNDINAAFDTDLADAVKTFTVHSETVDVDDFNADTGINAESVFEEGSLRGVMAAVTKEDIDTLGAEPLTSKILILQSEFVVLGFIPFIGDEFIRNSERFRVYKEINDPADVAKTYFVKRQ